MKTKTMTPEKMAKIAAKKEKEIAKWEKQKARPKGNTYFWYLVLIIALIYAVDEIASQIGTLMKTEIANDLFQSASSVTILNLLQVVAVPFQILGLLYRPLADRYGRKTFLVINTFGMSIALFVIFLSQNVAMYVLGACLIMFFIPHDMHVVFIMESSPQKRRAITYSVIKFFANMAVMLVPILRRLLMQNAGEWRKVYMIPAIVGIVISLIALLCARETDAFIDSRLRYLRMTDEEIRAEQEQKKADNAQGGLIAALKFGLAHKQLRWVFICFALAGIGVIGSLDYQTIITYGYAQSVHGGITDNFLNLVSINEVTKALILFPIGSAIAQVIMGFVSDLKGRKTAAITVAANCLVCFLGFTLGAKFNLNPYIVGFLCGAFVGSYYSTNDVLIMMASESAPTNLRSSTSSAQTVVGFVGYAFAYLIYVPVTMIFGNASIATVSLCLLVPSFAATLIALIKNTHDTKNVDLETVTGCEWD
ncbi:MAG: MFS transporter [Ruminococcaceae bacterium]|nr:MFS transporter [Oscillospiraceae bacterium]MBQ6873085.1 MFS transporter [Clostridia bacterium]